jgi:penicillin-binding protein 1A
MSEEARREEPVKEEPVKNVYRKGYFPRVRERLGAAWRTFTWAVRDPGAAFARFPKWLREQFRRDRRFFGDLFGTATGLVARGVRHPVHGRWVLGLFALAGFLVTWSWEMCGLTGCPDVKRLAALQPGGAATVYDAQGNVLAELAPVSRLLVEIGDLPKYVPQAFVSVEDQRYYSHHGVDWRRFLGTTARNFIPGRRSQGASTITMQVARNVFPDRLPASERTIKRKVLEIRVAREIERRYGKERILQTYLNNIYFGEGVYGIESAARIYFGKHASDITLAEAALLAGLPKAPSTYSPRRNLARSVQRRNLVLSLMGRRGASPPRRRPGRRRPGAAGAVGAAAAPAEGALLRGAGAPGHGRALRRGAVRGAEDPHHAGPAGAGRGRAAAGGAAGGHRERRVRALPRAAPLGVRDSAETPYLQGATVVMDARTGDVKALVGGRSFEESRFDRIMQGFRQPGSAFKPVVFAAAFEEGISPVERIDDAPLHYDLPGGEVWEPKNFDGRFRGPVTVRQTARHSINTSTIRLAEQVGLADVGAEARKLGITTDIPQLPSIAIGSAAVRPIELVRAYTPFATLGTRVEPRFVLRVEDARGKAVWKPRPRRRRVMDRGAAFLVTSLLRDVVDRGTGSRVRSAGLEGPVAGKTGTTNGATDAWFVGYTPELVGAVWIGFDRPRPIVGGGSGGVLAAPVWGRIVRAAQRGEAPRAWKEPAGVVERQVAVASYEVIAPGCRARGDTYDEWFLRAHVPPTVCPRGTAERETGIEAWARRQADRLGAAVGEWAEEAWSDAWGWVRGKVGLDPSPGGETKPREKEKAAPEEEPEVEPATEGVTDTVALPSAEPLPDVDVSAEPPPVEPPPAGPRDTIRLPGAPASPSPAPPDTIQLTP